MIATTVNDVRCPTCKAAPGEGCHTPTGNPCNEPHARRVDAYWKAQAKNRAKED